MGTKSLTKTKIIARVVQQPTIESTAAAILGAELYLNNEINAELYRRFGVSIRIHFVYEPEE